MNMQNNSIENFLQSVCKFIRTEEKAKDIQDELRDHIYSYIEEYTKDGMSTDAAITMALKQMGDPNILSKIYKDKTSKFSRLLHIFLVIIVLSISTFSGLAFSYINNFNNLNMFFISVLLDICINLCLGIYIIDIIRTYKKERELSKLDPLFYIQSYKSSIWEEKVIKYTQIFLITISFILLMSILSKFIHIQSSEVLSSFLFNLNSLSFFIYIIIYLSILTPKGKHTIVYSDGILTFKYFIPWNNIQGYMWSKESINGKVCYSLEFSLKKSSKISSGRAPIKVSSSQVNLINELLKNNNIDEIPCS
ncbi:hypothetical protein SDC9_112270 [bioreactor metagenome]|uniref:DUF5673 domain-containing protein n=1 Tax=bioreactor metagenome TaxID=1076179 RepID=A0A645BUA2_9ZZZZ